MEQKGRGVQVSSRFPGQELKVTTSVHGPQVTVSFCGLAQSQSGTVPAASKSKVDMTYVPKYSLEQGSRLI